MLLFSSSNPCWQLITVSSTYLGLPHLLILDHYDFKKRTVKKLLNHARLLCTECSQSMQGRTMFICIFPLKINTLFYTILQA